MAIVSLILMLPLVLLAMLIAVAAVLALLAPPSILETSWAGFVAALAIGLIVLVPVMIVVSFLLTNLYVLATRFIVLEDRSSVDAIAVSWGVVRHRFKDVFLMWLITVGFGLAFGIAVAVPAVAFSLGIGVTAYLGAWPVAVMMGLVMLAVFAFAGSAYSTFTSALWTIFFRRLTGREVVQPAPPEYAQFQPQPPVGA